ncbi:50S ribosomal protein L17 [Candidatus Curtissbacteria bacterium RBG_13_35_7]|uniref:50S ribosomal protein L17 n=1 Tax=Candidatus Curtissbacteria bacterium RBG_13_35_7 TaxID=1797705 RepID=A0A1F5G0U0_9BACT|nr:MAG: 50S ribosomal protein L17 [Candidatus Curtissbacteria bacterium RBG_13_35_7]
MRHAVFGKKLSRDINARKALLNNLTSSLFLSGQITTTLAKAKFANSYVEKIITKAKKNKLNNNRTLASKISKNAFIKLITEIGPGFEERKSGYTRIIKLASRRGDAAPMARLELLEWDKTKAIKLEKKDKKTRQKPKAVKEPKIGANKSATNASTDKKSVKSKKASASSVVAKKSAKSKK